MKNSISILFISLLFIGYINAQNTKEKKKWKFGLHFDNLSDTQKAFNAETTGVIINRVSKNHPAEAAGILVGDILTHIGTTEIIDQKHCIQIMKDFDTSSGKAILKVIRNGIKMEFTVKFE